MCHNPIPTHKVRLYVHQVGYGTPRCKITKRKEVRLYFILCSLCLPHACTLSKETGEGGGVGRTCSVYVQVSRSLM